MIVAYKSGFEYSKSDSWLTQCSLY